MGMCAIYQEVKKEDFKKLLESDDFFETIEELEEKDGTELCDIDKMWDALHYEINFQDYLKDFDMTNFAENGIYPDIWDYEEETDEIKEEIMDYFQNMKDFYKQVLEEDGNVLVTIY